MAYTPLSDDELKDMHDKLREQFSYASRMMGHWKTEYYNENNTKKSEDLVRGYGVGAPIASAMAESAKGLIAIEQELRDRERIHPQQPAKPSTPFHL